MNEILFYLMLVLLGTFLAFFVFKNKRLSDTNYKLLARAESLNSLLEAEKNNLLNLKKDYENVLEKLEIKHQKDLKELKEDYHKNIEKLDKTYQQNLSFQEQKHQETLEKSEERLKLNLKEQNEKVLNQNKIMLNEDSKKILDEIFKPIKQKVEEYSKNLTQNEAVLKSNIENVFKFSQNLSQNADKLASILKGEKKLRGNFAEMQLKSVLAQSGLVEGEQYKLQEHFKDEDKSFYPDAIVYLDKDKRIVIDAKFSLPSDFEFEGSVSESVCAQLASNLKARIDELSKKPYLKFSNYEYTLLFIPYGNILDLALSAQNSLYQYAYSKNIYLTTPHTLFMALKTISITWTHIQSDDKVQKAFEELGKFYDKFALFCEDFESLKRNLRALNVNAENMKTKLIDGKGNLASRFHNLKDLGAKTSKNISLQFDKESDAKIELVKENLKQIKLDE